MQQHIYCVKYSVVPINPSYHTPQLEQRLFIMAQIIQSLSIFYNPVLLYLPNDRV